LRKFANGAGVEQSAFGAYYCYLHLFPAAIRVRVARVLGPFPAKLRVVRYVLFCGLSLVEGFELSVLPGGDLHVGSSGGVAFPLWMVVVALMRSGRVEGRIGVDIDDVRKSFVAEPSMHHARGDVMEVAALAGVKFSDCGSLQDIYGDVVSIKADPTLVTQNYVNGSLVDMLAIVGKFGIVVPSEGYQDLALVTYTTGTVPDSVPSGKMRLRMLALLGDRVVKVLLTAQGMSLGMAVASVQALEAKRQSNSALIECAQKCGLSAIIKFPPGVSAQNAKILGTSVEALIGVIAKWCPMAAVHEAASRLGVIMDAKRAVVVASKAGSLEKC